MAGKTRQERVLSILAASVPVGSAKVYISALKIYSGRAFSRAVAAYLENVFSEIECLRCEKIHRVPVVVQPAELKYLLASSGITMKDISTAGKSKEFKTLNVPASKKLLCVHGQHRLAAAEATFPPEEQWWIADIFVFSKNDTSLPRFVQQKQEEFYHQSQFSDGEIYQHVRKHRNSTINLRKWKARLSQSKLTGLNQLLRHELFTKAFDELRVFPGLWEGLQLGNIQSILAMRCDEEVLCYLQHIKTTWDQITLNNEKIKSLVSIEVVQTLELRAPEVSKIDREAIAHALDHATLFPSLSPLTRKAIKRATLGLRVIIPSIKSLHENLKFIEIGAMILKEVVFDKNLRTTIRATFNSCLNPSRRINVEVRKGHIVEYECQVDECRDLLYKQLWLSTFRDFPDLSGTAPRKERGQQAHVDQTKCLLTQHELATFAIRLGIRTRKLKKISLSNPKLLMLQRCLSEIYSTSPIDWIEQTAEKFLTQLPQEERQPSLAASKACFSSFSGESLERRWGRPFQKSFDSFKELTYLPNLIDSPHEALEALPTALYVQRDLLSSFFGRTSARTFSNSTVIRRRQISRPQEEAVSDVESSICEDEAFMNSTDQIQDEPEYFSPAEMALNSSRVQDQLLPIAEPAWEIPLDPEEVTMTGVQDELQPAPDPTPEILLIPEEVVMTDAQDELQPAPDPAREIPLISEEVITTEVQNQLQPVPERAREIPLIPEEVVATEIQNQLQPIPEQAREIPLMPRQAIMTETQNQLQIVTDPALQIISNREEAIIPDPRGNSSDSDRRTAKGTTESESAINPPSVLFSPHLYEDVTQHTISKSVTTEFQPGGAAIDFTSVQPKPTRSAYKTPLNIGIDSTLGYTISFLEYSKKKLRRHAIPSTNLRPYLYHVRSWNLLGGEDFEKSSLIKPDAREQTVQQNPFWKFVFVPQKDTNFWKQNCTALIATLDKDNNTSLLGPYKPLIIQKDAITERGMSNRNVSIVGLSSEIFPHPSSSNEDVTEVSAKDKTVIPRPQAMQLLLKRVFDKVDSEQATLRAAVQQEAISHWIIGQSSTPNGIRKRGKKEIPPSLLPHSPQLVEFAPGRPSSVESDL